jgi:hypothetical protein
MRGATLHCRRDANDGGGHGKSMPLLIAFGFFVLIVAPVLLGSRLFGPYSWPIQSDREEQKRARIDSEQRGGVTAAFARCHEVRVLTSVRCCTRGQRLPYSVVSRVVGRDSRHLAVIMPHFRPAFAELAADFASVLQVSRSVGRASSA